MEQNKLNCEKLIHSDFDIIREIINERESSLLQNLNSVYVKKKHKINNEMKQIDAVTNQLHQV